MKRLFGAHLIHVLESGFSGMKRLNLGFTLIELMIVVAIIGVLAAIAIPQYENYVARTQVAEALSLAPVVKTAYEEYYSVHGALPPENKSSGGRYSDQEMHQLLGLPMMWRPSQYVRHVRARTREFWTGAEIMFNSEVEAANFSPGGTISSKIAGKKFWLLAIVDSATGSLTWECSCKRRQFHNCGDDQEILEEYLPSSCTNIGRP